MKLKRRNSGILIMILLSLVIDAQSQTKFDPGKVKSDPNFNCGDTSEVLWCSNISTISRICDSKNQMEIRLSSGYLPNGGNELIILSFSDGKWNAQKYSYKRGPIGDNYTYTGIRQNQGFEKIDEHNFNLIFDTLKVNNVFLLPEQKTLKLGGHVADGKIYSIVFKVNQNYRRYSFNNPNSYMINNKGINELKQYAQIVQYLNSLFN